MAISRIYRHDREVPSQAPPLAQAGVNVTDGDVITEINGVEISTTADLHRALRNQAGKQVLLQLLRGRESIETVVVPSAANQDSQYRYNDWVHGKRNKVEAAGTELGYVHLRAMGNRDAAEFAREF